MKNFIFLTLLLSVLSAWSQESDAPLRWRAHASIGQFPASIISPDFSAIHPGLHVGVAHQWNKHLHHQLVQTANLGYFFHRDIQHAIQAYTELGYQIRFNKGISLTPLAIGGGYTLSIPDMQTLKWDPVTETYSPKGFAPRNNWMISLGASLSYESNLAIFSGRKTTFFVDYRIQIQGVVVKETVPVLAYAPIKVGISIPIEGPQKSND